MEILHVHAIILKVMNAVFYKNPGKQFSGIAYKNKIKEKKYGKICVFQLLVKKKKS